MTIDGQPQVIDALPAPTEGTARTRRPSTTRVAGAIAIVALVVLALVFGFTVVSTEDEAASRVGFDPVTYVDGIWDDVRSAITDGAVPLADVLNRMQPDDQGKAAKADLLPIAQELGLVTTGEALVYRVKASGTVTDADVASSRGSIGLQVDGYDGPIKVRVYVGTRIPSDESSVRDAAGFIQFGDFREQTEYGKVASEINKRVVTDLQAGGVAGKDAAALVGKPVTVTGAFTLRTFNQPQIDVSTIDLVPVELAAR
jgi:predicted lipoprotein